MPLNCSREHSWVFCWNGDFQKLFSLVFTSRHRTIKLFFWNHLLWMLNWSHYSIRLSSSLSQKCRFYSPKWNLQLSLPTTSNPTRYTHFRILLHKSRDDYLKHTRILTKLQIKSQILKSITHTPKIPQVWLWNVSELWFWIYFMISTQLYFQYRFPCFSVVATMKKCIYELCGPQVRVGRMRPSTEKQATFFFFFLRWGEHFPKYGTVNREVQEDFGNVICITSGPKGSLAKSPQLPGPHLWVLLPVEGVLLCFPHSKSGEKNDLKREPVLIAYGLSHKPSRQPLNLWFFF